jgi:hypothetical protein
MRFGKVIKALIAAMVVVGLALVYLLNADNEKSAIGEKIAMEIKASQSEISGKDASDGANEGESKMEGLQGETISEKAFVEGARSTDKGESITKTQSVTASNEGGADSKSWIIFALEITLGALACASFIFAVVTGMR